MLNESKLFGLSVWEKIWPSAHHVPSACLWGKEVPKVHIIALLLEIHSFGNYSASRGWDTMDTFSKWLVPEYHLQRFWWSDSGGPSKSILNTFPGACKTSQSKELLL